MVCDPGNTRSRGVTRSDLNEPTVGSSRRKDMAFTGRPLPVYGSRHTTQSTAPDAVTPVFPYDERHAVGSQRFPALLGLLGAIAVVLTLLSTAPRASASGGQYIFDGGTAAEQATVRSALNASTFNWGIIPRTITVHITRSVTTEAVAGEVWLDSGLLDTGQFSWGIVQHEFAHQVDFLMLNDDQRTQLQGALGAKDWCYADSTLAHAQHGCERFASTLAWAYWQSGANVLKPTAVTDESAAMSPSGRCFRPSWALARHQHRWRVLLLMRRS